VKSPVEPPLPKPLVHCGRLASQNPIAAGASQCGVLQPVPSSPPVPMH